MTTYREAGVDLDGATSHVRRISTSVQGTWNERVVGAFGGFAAGVELPEGYRRPVLMMTTDGVGTKLELARRAGQWAGVGRDLVAMCVDDLAALGADPIGFVDYLAVGALDPDRDATIVESIAEACREAGCPLLGGETAEHPGVMPHDAVDLAAGALGVVEHGSELGAHRVSSGDRVIGLHSPNPRSNGFSLIRSAMGDAVDHHIDQLLEPSVIYANAVLAAVAAGGVNAGAHVTGGGIASNLSRVMPDGHGVSIDTAAWSVPDIFRAIEGFGIGRDEMFRTFNMGIGFCLIVDASAVDDVIASVSGHHPTVIGVVTDTPGVRLG